MAKILQFPLRGECLVERVRVDELNDNWYYRPVEPVAVRASVIDEITALVDRVMRRKNVLLK